MSDDVLISHVNKYYNSLRTARQRLGFAFHSSVLSTGLKDASG